MDKVIGYTPFAKITKHSIQFQQKGIDVLEDHCDFSMEVFLIGFIGKQTFLYNKISRQDFKEQHKPDNIIWISEKSRKCASNVSQQFLSLQFNSTSKQQLEIVHSLMILLCSMVFINEACTPEHLKIFQFLKNKCEGPSKMFGELYFLNRTLNKHDFSVKNASSMPLISGNEFAKYIGVPKIKQIILAQDSLITEEELVKLEKQVYESYLRVCSSQGIKNKIRFGPQLFAFAEQISIALKKEKLIPQNCVADVEIGLNYAAYLESVELFNRDTAKLEKDINVTTTDLQKILDFSAENSFAKFIELQGNSKFMHKLVKYIHKSKQQIIEKVNAEKHLKQVDWLKKAKEKLDTKLLSCKNDEQKVKQQIDLFLSDYEKNTDGKHKYLLASKLMAMYTVKYAKEGGNEDFKKQAEDTRKRLQAENADLARRLASKDKCCLLM